jgi:hypothetical protein
MLEGILYMGEKGARALALEREINPVCQEVQRFISIIDAEPNRLGSWVSFLPRKIYTKRAVPRTFHSKSIQKTDAKTQLYTIPLSKYRSM